MLSKVYLPFEKYCMNSSKGTHEQQRDENNHGSFVKKDEEMAFDFSTSYYFGNVTGSVDHEGRNNKTTFNGKFVIFLTKNR